MSDWPYILTVDRQNGSEVNLTEWLVTTDRNITSDDQQETALDLAASLLVGFFLAIIIFLSVAGNLLVCIAVYTDRTLRKVGNLFIVSLAISDLFVACLVMVFAVANDLQGFWVFGDQFCDIWVAFDVMCCTASILNLCAISMDRYIHIKDPLRYGRWMTKRVIYSSIGAIWLLAALISFLPVSMDLHKPQGQQQLMVMEEQFDDEFSNSISDSMDLMANSDETRMMMGAGALVISSEDTVETVSVLTDPIASLPSPQCALDLTPTYAIVSSCISFYLPCLVMLAIYSRLFFYAKMHVQNIKAVTRPVILLGRFEPDPNQQATSSEVAQTPASTKKQKKKRRHYQSSSANSTSQQNSYHVSDHKAAITLGIIMGVFLICWVPFFCVNIVAAFCKTCIPPIVFKILTWLGYSNSAFNPIIYSIFNLDFRLAFQKILTVKTRSFCCHRYDDYDYEQRSRGNSNGGPAAAAQGSHSQYRMDHLRNQQQQQQLQTNGHQSGANRMEESNRHPLLPSSAHADDDPQTDHHSSEDGHSTVLMVSASSGHIISPANINSIKPHHVKTVTSIRQDSGQQLLIAEKVV